ncbi:MAG TPA: hypothetical protein VJJ98_11135 [Sedimentisphaerales bacterium]|nr:hypothetical protein [Sedimentisphaerales bacterium]
MRKVILFVMLSMFLLYPSGIFAEELSISDPAKTAVAAISRGPIDPEAALPKQDVLFSPSVAQVLHDMAYEMVVPDTAGSAEIEQAIVLLRAAMELDSGAGYIVPTLIEAASKAPEVDHSPLVHSLLVTYVNQSADLEVAGKAVRYLLEKVDSREGRERILSELLMVVGPKNRIFSSELLTALGLLMAEKPDNEATRFYLTQAYTANRHNRSAFWKFAELFPEAVHAENYLAHFRLALSEDPSSIEAAMGMGRHAEQVGLYDTAASAYRYCADLFKHFYPSQSLPSAIYIPWAVSCYNTDEDLSRCMEILNLVRQDGRFNILLEGLAGKAAAKLGDGDRATEIFRSAEAQAQALLSRGPASGAGVGQSYSAKQRFAAKDENKARQQVTAKEFAWFYCFALPSREKALDWANKAYALEPNSASSASVLAYALMMNEQANWAKPLIEKIEPSQISELVQAKIQIAEGKKDEAKATLTAAIARDAGSLAAEEAKALLKEQGGEYVPAADPDVVRSMLEQAFGESFMPVFTPPEQMLSIQFNMRGNKFPYGSEFGAVVAVINNSSETFVVSDDGLFRGNIRIDADVSGDLSIKIPKLASMKVRSNYFIEPAQSILIPVKLVTGKLRRLLLTYPQASLDIKFTLYIDPVAGPAGETANRLATIEPTALVVMRPGIELTSKYLRNRFNLISKGQEGQKIKTAQLFVGLLMEQYAMSNRKPPYKFMYADWMPTMFRNALVHESGLLRKPDKDEWVVKVHTMAEMQFLPLDYELVSAVADNLDDSNWPVRMMTMYLLAKTQKGKFDKVLESAATYDPDARVREMAVALGAVAVKAPALDTIPTAEEQAQPIATEEK